MITRIAVIAVIAALSIGCDLHHKTPSSASGVNQTSATVTTNQNGRTVEQENIIARLKMDNLPGSIKHLYVISPYSGQTIIYSTVKGKVTSGGKRLTPTTLTGAGEWGGSYQTAPINGDIYRTSEVLQDDGTYGSSTEHIFWTDVQGRYHQHFFTGGQIIHVSDQPLPVRQVIINLEAKE